MHCGIDTGWKRWWYKVAWILQMIFHKLNWIDLSSNDVFWLRIYGSWTTDEWLYMKHLVWIHPQIANISVFWMTATCFTLKFVCSSGHWMHLCVFLCLSLCVCVCVCVFDCLSMCVLLKREEEKGQFHCNDLSHELWCCTMYILWSLHLSPCLNAVFVIFIMILRVKRNLFCCSQ